MDHVALVVSGSASSWIRKKILKSKGGLYNRVTHRIKLRPFTLAETEAFCKSKKIKLSHYQIKKALGISGIYTSSSSWKHVGNNEVPGAQIDLLIDRDDQIINICEAKFTKKEFAITKSFAAELRRKLSVFQFVTGTKKSVHTTLLSTYPAFRNEYYNEHIQSEVTMDALFNE